MTPCVPLELEGGQRVSGRSSVTSGAVDSFGNVQPAMDDPLIAKKHTYRESNGQVTRHVQIS
jgi:hypothetical protein